MRLPPLMVVFASGAFAVMGIDPYFRRRACASINACRLQGRKATVDRKWRCGVVSIPTGEELRRRKRGRLCDVVKPPGWDGFPGMTGAGLPLSSCAKVLAR